MAWPRWPGGVSPPAELRPALSFVAGSLSVVLGYRFRPAGANAEKGCQRTLDLATVQPLHDEDQARSPVRIGPGREMHGRMHQMLHTMDRYRCFHAGDIQNALYAQDFLPVPIKQHGEPDAERDPIQLRIEGEGKGFDILSVPVGIEGFMSPVAMIFLCFP